MNTISTLASEDVLKKLKSYSLLLDESQKFSDLIKKMKQRQQESDPIFKRVHDDYQSRKSEIDESLVQEREQFVREFQELQAQNQVFQQEYSVLRNRLKELNFRYILGEYSEADIQEEGKSLMQQVYGHMKTLSLLEEVMYLYMNIIGFDSSEILDGEGQAGEKSIAGNKSFLEIINDEQHLPPKEVVSSFTVPIEEPEEDYEEPPEEDTGSDAIGTPVSETMKSAAKKQSIGTWMPPQGQLTVLEGDCKEDRISLASGDILFGSTPGTDVLLEDPGVAEAHARVFFKDQKYFMKNLDPMGRSYVNGVQQNLLELNDGDVIRLGETMIMRLDLSRE